MTAAEKPTAERTGPRAFRLGDRLMEPDQGQLTRAGDKVRVEPKAMEVLVYLSGRQGEVVTMADLERDRQDAGSKALAMAEARHALALDPNYADAYALLSSASFFAGNLEKTLELDREAMRLDPASSFIYHVHLGRTNYLKGNF